MASKIYRISDTDHFLPLQTSWYCQEILNSWSQGFHISYVYLLWQYQNCFSNFHYFGVYACKTLSCEWFSYCSWVIPVIGHFSWVVKLICLFQKHILPNNDRVDITHWAVSIVEVRSIICFYFFNSVAYYVELLQ